MADNDHRGARAVWARLEPLVSLLFQEPNPMPIKHCLWRQGLIRSAECRLPLTQVSAALGHELEHRHRCGAQHQLAAGNGRGRLRTTARA